MRRVLAIPVLVVVSACSSAKPPAVAPNLRAAERLADADRLIRAGCYDCLLAAYREYDALRSAPGFGVQATARTIRAAALVAIRERELGMVDTGHLQIARDLLNASPDATEWLAKTLEIADLLPGGIVGVSRPPASDSDLTRMMGFNRNQSELQDLLRGFAGADEVAAYTYTTLGCARMAPQLATVDQIFDPAAPFAGTPLLTFRRATCRGQERQALESILEQDARFLEVNYLLGLAAVGRRDLEGADALYRRAYAWQPKWPALTLSLANLAMTAEEFESAVGFYQETLALQPQAVEARLGKVRALTYAGRNEEAIAETDILLQGRWNLGDVRYWRALNETQIRRYDEAWTDIEESAKLLINAAVPKLAGVISYRRQQLDVSRAKFEESHTRNPNDCETRFYLGVVHAEQRNWPKTADVLVGAASCLEESEKQLNEEIATIRASTDPPARQAKQIARRERDIANGRRMIATCWFNTAVAYYSLSRGPEARQYAEKVVDDEEFGDRAKEIISRLR